MSSGFPGLSAIIPAYNEAGRIGRAILDTKCVLGDEAEIIVVDDGSSDATAQEALEAGARVVRHDRNRGKGAAVKTGALASKSEWILVLDADLSTHPREIQHFQPYFDHSDLVIGSRRADGSFIPMQQPLYRVKAGQVFNWLMRTMCGLPYQDTQCGFKVYRMELCRPLFQALTTEGWSFDVELLLRARLADARITELPVTWQHVDGSKVKIRHTLAILIELWRLRRIIPQDRLDDSSKN